MTRSTRILPSPRPRTLFCLASDAAIVDKQPETDHLGAFKTRVSGCLVVGTSETGPEAWSKSRSLGRSVAEQLLTFLSEKTASHRDGVIALLEDEPAGDETGSPL